MMGRMAYHFDNVRKSVISLSGGTKISEFHNIDEINRNFNTLYSLYFKQNYLKLYDEKSVSLNYSTDLNYDQRITLSSGFYQRKDLLIKRIIVWHFIIKIMNPTNRLIPMIAPYLSNLPMYGKQE